MRKERGTEDDVNFGSQGSRTGGVECDSARATVKCGTVTTVGRSHWQPNLAALKAPRM